MLIQSLMSTVYLKRRVRLFQVGRSRSRNSNSSSHEDQQQYVERTKQNWVCILGQNLVAQTIDLRKVRCLIQSAHPDSIIKVGQCVMQMIKLAIEYQPPSKISNIIYYLCRRNFKFRQQVSKYFKQISQSLKFQKWNSFKQNHCIIFTDMFVFGIYFTQQQFISQILTLVFNSEPINENSEQKAKYQYFRLHYILQYFDVLTRPQIMLERYRNKFIDISFQFVQKLVNYSLKNAKNLMIQKLHVLQQAYISKKENQQGNIISQTQTDYLKSVKDYEKYRKSIASTLQGILQSLKTISCNCGQCEELMDQINRKFISIVNDNQSEQKQKVLEQQKDYQQSSSLSSRDSKSPDEKPKEQESELLMRIYNSCRHFRNKDNFIRDQVYVAAFPEYKISAESGRSFKFIQVLPDFYIEKVKNCADIKTSNDLCEQFLSEYNKHGNRFILIDTIFKQLFERNNIAYIVRVLYGVYQHEKTQIMDLIKDQLSTLKGRTNLRVSRGIFGKFSSVCIQLVKFGLTDCQTYLQQLHYQVKLMDRFPLQKESQSQTNININDKGFIKEYRQQFLNITQIINLLQKLGRDAYYSTLNTHIKFNQIIGSVYRHIKIKSISYDVETINRFNGLVLYLQNINLCRQEKVINIIPIQQLRNDRQFKQIVKNFQKQLKANGQQIHRIIDVLVNSISTQNYIHSYYYAGLIQQIDSKPLDNAITSLTMEFIQEQFDGGNFQGATNWCRFLGELHRYGIIKQKQFVAFLQNSIIQKYMPLNNNVTVKIVSSALQACKDYMKKTNKLSQIEESLKFLMSLKKIIINNGCLTNTIVQHEIIQIMQYFHPAFKYLTKQEDFAQLEFKIYGKCNIEKLFSQFERNAKLRQQASENIQLQQIKTNNHNVDYLEQVELYKQKLLTFKYLEKGESRSFSSKKLRYAEKANYSSLGYFQQSNNFKLQKSELQTNQSIKQHEKKLETVTNQCWKQIQPLEKIGEQISHLEKPKKIKVIGRRKDLGNKIEKVQIVIE